MNLSNPKSKAAIRKVTRNYRIPIGAKPITVSTPWWSYTVIIETSPEDYFSIEYLYKTIINQIKCFTPETTNFHFRLLSFSVWCTDIMKVQVFHLPNQSGRDPDVEHSSIVYPGKNQLASFSYEYGALSTQMRFSYDSYMAICSVTRHSISGPLIVHFNVLIQPDVSLPMCVIIHDTSATQLNCVNVVDMVEDNSCLGCSSEDPSSARPASVESENCQKSKALLPKCRKTAGE